MRGRASSKQCDDDGENTFDADAKIDDDDADATTWRSGTEDDFEEEEEEEDDGPGERGYAGERGRHRSEVSRRTRGGGSG